ncbi:MAG: hypothetical protein OXG79_12310 [Chloroflexi bacterium]|nr:hypothetical protein [Chloroflexota bacterium]
MIDPTKLIDLMRSAADEIEIAASRERPGPPECLQDPDGEHHPKHEGVRAKQLRLLERVDAIAICGYIDHDRDIPDDLIRRWVILRCAVADERQAAAMERIADSLESIVGALGDADEHGAIAHSLGALASRHGTV